MLLFTQKRKFEYKHFVLLCLVLIFILSMVDRQLVAVLSPVIKQELDLSDTELGFLKGFAFILVYSFIGLPIAHWADHHSRVNVIFSSLTLWSVFTLLCGFAQNFCQLALARFGFGIGAAGCSPPAHSLIAEYFSGAQRNIAISIYTLGIPLAHMFTFVIGSWLNSHWGWKTTFIIFGGLGLAMLTLRVVITEPARSLPTVNHSEVPAVKFVSGLKQLLAIPSIRKISLGAGLGAFGVSGVTAWIIDFFHRVDAINYQDLSTMVGLGYGIFGCTGMLTGSILTNKLGKVNPRYYLKIPSIAVATCAPILIFTIWVSDAYVSLLLLNLVILLMYSYQGAIFALIPALVPRQLRSRASALVILAMNMLGAGLGPLVVGVVSDAMMPVYPQQLALNWGMSVLAVAFAMAGLIFFSSSRTLHLDMQKP